MHLPINCGFRMQLRPGCVVYQRGRNRTVSEQLVKSAAIVRREIECIKDFRKRGELSLSMGDLSVLIQAAQDMVDEVPAAGRDANPADGKVLVDRATLEEVPDALDKLADFLRTRLTDHDCNEADGWHNLAIDVRASLDGS